MKKTTRDYIEAELRDYHKTLGEIANLKEDLLNESPLPPDGMPRGSTKSDPTFQRTVKLITCRQLGYMCRVSEGIAAALDSLPPEKMALVKLKYWTKPQTLTDIGMSIKLNCHRNTFYLWRNEVCEEIAKQLGIPV